MKSISELKRALARLLSGGDKWDAFMQQNAAISERLFKEHEEKIISRFEEQLDIIKVEMVKEYEAKLAGQKDKTDGLELVQNKLGSQLDRIDTALKFITYPRIIRGIEDSISAVLLHQETFKPFKNKHAGQTVVMCGAAPSLEYYQPIENAVHVALNRSFLYEKVKFDYLFSTDFSGISHLQEQVKAYCGNNCVKFFGLQNASSFVEIPESLALECDARRYMTDKELLINGLNFDYDYDFSKSEFAFDLSSTRLGNFWTISLEAIQFILYTHPCKIYIVGCDFAGGHFNNSNLTDEAVNRQVSAMNNFWSKDGELREEYMQSWYKLKEFVRIYYPDIEVISLNPVALKGLFNDEYTNEYLKDHPEVGTGAV